jgi:predicted ArsR family transcriptional regulator
VAAEFPELCEAETAAFSALLGTHVQRLATIAHGDGVCTTYIPNAITKNAVNKTSAQRGN